MAFGAQAFGGLPHGYCFGSRYRIEESLGLSRTSALYRVLDTRTARRRALKILLPSLLSDAKTRERFELEARITAAIDCRHIVDVLDAGIDEATGLPFLVMELLEGRDLAACLAEGGPMPPKRVLDIVHQVARGLEHACERGIAHRDIKPENLFLHRPGELEERVVIVDFGIAKSTGTTGSTDAVLGTPLYVAPEQVHFRREEVGPAADLYAVGMVTYTLLVGEPYFSEEEEAADGVMPFLLEVVSGTTERATARAERRRGIRLPAAFDAWFARATARRPGDRHASPADLVATLAEALGLAPPSPGSPAGSAAVANSVPVVSQRVGDDDADDPAGAPAPSPRGRRARWGAIILSATLLATVGVATHVGARLRGGQPLAPRPSEPEPERGGATSPASATTATSPAGPPAESATAQQVAVPVAPSSAPSAQSGKSRVPRTPLRPTASVSETSSQGYIPPLTER